MKKDIGSLSYEQLQQEMNLLGIEPFHARQIYQWLHVKGATSFEEMTDLSKSLREELADQYEILPVELVDRQISEKDGTNKFLFRLFDGNLIESVLMPYQHGNSVCISSQAGCRMGCRFCASAIGGLDRNLYPSEMLGQVYAIQKIMGERISNVVVMGTGEPLDNYEYLLIFLRMLTDEHGLHISQRNVTVSTCGIVPGILDLAEEKLQITLALSLHAATQEKRRQLMPVADRYPLSEVLSACDTYAQATGRRMTFEYSLIEGFNDSEEDVKNLAAILKERHGHLNLIRVNPIRESEFRHPTRENALNFKNNLEKSGINVTIRREMGSDIDGACGQLRHRYACLKEVL